MGYGCSLELQILITAFADAHRVVMIDSSPPVLKTIYPHSIFMLVKLMLRLPKNPAEDSATIGLEPRFTNFAAPARCSRPVYPRLSIYEYTLQA